MSQQSKTGFGVANPVPYSPDSRLNNLDTNPSDKQPPGVDEEITIHEKMYRLATQNGSTIGGSEHCHDDHS